MEPAEPSEREVAEWQRWAANPPEATGQLDRAPGLTKEETLQAVAERLGSVIVGVREARGERETALSPERFGRWHHTLFRGLFHDTPGQFRREWEQVSYSVVVFDEQRGELRSLPAHGVPGDALPKRLQRAFAEFDAAAPTYGQPVSALDAAAATAQLYTDVYRMHPFIDGNTRTSFILLQAALYRLGQPEFTLLPADWEVAAARSWANRPDERASTEPLAALIAHRLTREGTR